MICLACGSTIRGDASRCGNCGAAPGDTATGVFDALTAPPLAGGGMPTLVPPAAGDEPAFGPISAAGDALTISDLAHDNGHTLATLAPEGSEGPAAGDTGPLAIGAAFGTRYHIIRPLGLGGMGAVYQAWDADLGVAVAIKVIRPEIMSNPSAAAEVEGRFKRELLLARQVTHRNVVRIHDLGEIDGIKYITMAFVNGTDLVTRLKQEGRLPVAAVLRITRSVVAGLIAAHGAGIVHRDLKPANIMIDADGEALIMDFGIARSADRNAPVGPGPGVALGALRRIPVAAQATMAGVVVGTVEYMAPEQAKAQDVDQRADIYSLGLIVYDALTGRHRARHTGSAIAELQGRMKQAPPSIRTIAADVPEALERIVARCLEPDPALRFQTTTELLAALDRLDDNGQAIRVKRMVGMKSLAAIVALPVLLLGGTWWFAGSAAPEAPHEPVSVVIADFDNRTGDATFDRTLEPMLKRVLDEAGFISAYDRSGISRTLGEAPPATLDAGTAAQIAVKQGLGVVISGAIEPQGSGYSVTLKAIHAVTGEEITSERGRAADKDQVLAAATRLVTSVRRALGDNQSESDQMFAMASLSATSLDVVRQYAAAQDAMSNARFDDALEAASRAVALDPQFGIGYQVMSVASRNLGRSEDAQKYIDEALKYLDGMTERERYTTRGMFYRITGDYEKCVKEYGDLLARYAGDPVAHNQLALCSTQLRDMPTALNAMREVVRLLPSRAIFRVNLALYASYAGDFRTGEVEARKIENPEEFGVLALALAQLGQGQTGLASETYRKLAAMSPRGASLAASGLGDVAVYEGRLSDAVRILQKGAAANLEAKNTTAAAAKYTALAHAHLAAGRKAPARAAAERALAASSAVTVRFLSARTLAEAGEPERARTLAAGLASELQAEAQAYAKAVEGVVLLNAGRPREAIKALDEANSILDTWIGRFDLGRAYLAAGLFAQADSEFDRALKRRGEAIALFLDEEPTFGYFPAVHYYQGLVREGLESAGADEAFRSYLTIRGQSSEDPLAVDAKRRLPSDTAARR